MRSIIKNLKDNSGGIYIEFLAGIMVLMMVLVSIVSVLSVFSIKHELDNANSLLLQKAEMIGSTDLSDDIDDLKDKTGLDFRVSFEGTEYMQGNPPKVQLGDDIQVSVFFDYEIGAGDLVNFPITISSSFSGISQRYHK